MSVNSELKATKIIGQRKAFYRKRIPEFICARKETVDIDILVRHNLNSWLMMLHQKHVHTLHSHEAPYLCHDSPTTGISKTTTDPLEPGLDDNIVSTSAMKAIFSSRNRVKTPII